MRMYWFFAALLLSAALLFFQIWALSDYLYWRYVWFDIPMHFLGGLTLGTFAIGFFHSFKPRLYIALVVSVIVGWEVFEYLLGFPREANYAFDTSLDLLMGTLGASVAYTIARFSLWRSA